MNLYDTHTSVESAEFAWACGFFEGEGTVSYLPIRPGATRMVRQISCVQKNPEALHRLQAAFGGVGRMYGPNKGSDCHHWKCMRWVDLEPLLTRMLPFLCTDRRAKAEAMLANPPSTQGRKGGLTECSRGHDYTDPANIYTWTAPDGSRTQQFCRQCMKIRASENRERRNAQTRERRRTQGRSDRPPKVAA